MSAPGERAASGGLDPGGRIEADGEGTLRWRPRGGPPQEGLRPVRAFPLSAPSQLVALVDRGGRELAMIDDLEALPQDERALVESTLASLELMPVIERVLELTETGEDVTWTVETDRGRTRFRVRRGEGVREVEGFGVLVTDAHGLRFRIPSVAGLDASSRRRLASYL